MFEVDSINISIAESQFALIEHGCFHSSWLCSPMLYFHHMKMQKSINRRIYPRINPWIFAYPRIVLAPNFLSLFVRLKIHGFSYPRIYPRIVDNYPQLYLYGSRSSYYIIMYYQDQEICTTQRKVNGHLWEALLIKCPNNNFFYKTITKKRSIQFKIELFKKTDCESLLKNVEKKRQKRSYQLKQKIDCVLYNCISNLFY